MVKDLSIIIVSWNVREYLEANLTRLFSMPCKYTREVFVVDNGSSDGSAVMVRERFPQVRLIQNDWDAGFAYPNNQAMRIADGRVIVLLNPDMLVGENVLDRTYETLMNDRSIGVLGVCLNDAEGRALKTIRRYPTFGSQLAILLKLQHFFPKLMSWYEWWDFDYTRSRDVDQVRGSYFAFRRDTMDTVGMLDSDYHIWFEEVDYCRRVRAKGMRVFYLANVACEDKVGRGVSKMKRAETQAVFTASMAHYFRKWHPWWQYAVISVLRPFAIFAARIADLVGYKTK